MTLINIIDIIAFIFCIVWVGYLFVFTLFSLGRAQFEHPKPKREYAMAILVPAYKEDSVIGATVAALIAQDYPREQFNIVVISDHMHEQTNGSLRKLPITLLEPSFEQSTKAKALSYAIEHLKDKSYEIVVILDADNIVAQNFLADINKSYNYGARAIQAHRIAKNLNSDTAILDAVSEEINNTIFRKGHVGMGISAALSGSGMAFSYKWLEQNIVHLCTSGEDKELEILLLDQGIYIEYLDQTIVLDEKTPKDAAFYNQRRRWLAAQFAILTKSIHLLPGAIAGRNIDLCDKLFQWMMPPRILLMGTVGAMAVLTLIINWEISVKWWIITFLLLLTFAIATPDYLITKDFKRALRKAPLLGVMMFLGIFRLRGMSKKFVSTTHGE